MIQQGIAPHESFELHELLTFKNVCLTKSVTMSALVSDERLKALLQQDISMTENHIKDLKNLMEQSALSVSMR